MLLSPASCLLGLLLTTKTPEISEHELQQAMEEGADYIKSATVEKDFVIVKSTASYRDARRAAEDAARRLGVPGVAAHVASQECPHGIPCNTAV